MRLTVVAMLVALGVCFVPGQPPRLALVLSGGGSRGMAQIGVLKALEEGGVVPDLIVCTSMGAIIGGLFAVGYSAAEIDKLAHQLDLSSLFADDAPRRYMQVSQKHEPTNYLVELRFRDDLRPLLPQSISYGQVVYDILGPRVSAAAYHAHMDFDSLPIALRVVGTDIVTGECVVFSRGSVATAVRASCGVPLAFSPTRVGTMLVLDGGLTANIPTQIAESERPGLLVAVDVTSPLWERQYLDSPVRIADQVINIGMNRLKEQQHALADILVKPDLRGFRNTDFGDLDVLIERGYVAARAVLPEIKQRLAVPADGGGTAELQTGMVRLPLRWSKAPAPLGEGIDSVSAALANRIGMEVPRDTLEPLLRSLLDRAGYPFGSVAIHEETDSGTYVAVVPGTIADIHTHGNDLTSSRLVRTASGLRRGEVLRNSSIESATRSLYGTGLFGTVSIDFDTSNNVNINVEEKPYWRTRLGLRYDDFHLGEGYIQPAYENLFGTGSKVLLHLQYGLVREKYSLELQGSPLFTSNWASNIRLQGYVSRERIVERQEEDVVLDTTTGYSEVQIDYRELTLRKAGLMAMVGTQIGRIALLSGGVRLEKFKVHRSKAGAWEDPLGPSFRQGIRYLMLSIEVDDLDRFPFPMHGQKHYITVGGASDVVGGTESFAKATASAGYYFTLAQRHTFYPEIRFALANKALPDVERLFLGGAFSEEKYRDIGVYNYVPFVGMRPRSLTGDVMAVVHGEYRIEVGRDFFASALVDWGYVWNQPAFDFSRETGDEFLRDAPVGLGLGFAYNSPVGPVRLSWGRLLHASESFKATFAVQEENMIYFSVGHDF